MKSDIEKQRHSSRTTIGQTLRGVTMKKVLWGRNMKPIWKWCQLGNKCFPVCLCQDPRITRAHTAQNTKIWALLACRAQPTYPIPARCGTDTAGRGAFEPPPLRRVSFVQALQTSSKTNKRSSPADAKQNKRSRVCHRKIQNSSNYRLEMMPIFVNHPDATDIKIQPKSPEFLLDMRCFCNFSLVSLGIRPRSRRCAERTRQGEGRWSRPPKPALERSYLTGNSSSANRILRPRRKKTLDRIPEIKE